MANNPFNPFFSKQKPVSPFNPFRERNQDYVQKRQSLMANDAYSKREAEQLLAGQNPMKAGTVTLPKEAQPQVSRAGSGMAQRGLAVSPDTLEELRLDAEITDSFIADRMAETSPHFASQLAKVRKAHGDDPDAVTAFLNYRFYGDTAYAPVVDEPNQPKNYIAKVLDRVYGKAKNVLGQGGIMQKYNVGELSAPQALGRSATEIYRGALTPVTTPLTDVTVAGLQATGLDQAIQYGVEGVVNSELGQKIIPPTAEYLSNLPDNSPLVDAGYASMAGLDTLGVLGAQGVMNVGKRGLTSATHPFKTIRHPIQTSKYVLTGQRAKPAMQAPTSNVPRELTGKAKEAVEKGMDEKFMSFVADQQADTRAVMAKMTKAAHEGGNVLGGTIKHKEILGAQMMDNAAYVLEQKGAVGRALQAMKASVADDMVNLTDDYDNILVELRNKGVAINDKGKIISIAGASDDNIPILQRTVDFFKPDDAGKVIRSGRQIDHWRTKMFVEMNSAKAKLQQSSSGQSTFGFAEKITDAARRSALMKMSRGNRNIIAANDAYEKLATVTSKFLKAINYKGKLSIDAITAKELRAGEVALRTLGNASADTRDAFIELIKTARDFGRVSNVDDMALIRYADALEDVFPISPTRSLRGEMTRATRDATGNLIQDVAQGQSLKVGLINRLSEPVMRVYDKINGLTPENRFRLLMEVLESPPDTPFFTVARNALPDEIADDFAKTQVDARDMKPVAEAELKASALSPESGGARSALPEQPVQQPVNQGLQTSPTTLPDDINPVNFTPEERATGLIGGGGDDMARMPDDAFDQSSVTKQLEDEVRYGVKNVNRSPSQQNAIDAELAKSNVARYGKSDAFVDDAAKTIPKSLEPLAKEARKFKTSSDFVEWLRKSVDTSTGNKAKDMADAFAGKMSNAEKARIGFISALEKNYKGGWAEAATDFYNQVTK